MASEKKPVLSLGPYSCGGGSQLEGAVWDNEVEVDGGKTITVSAVSFSRNYREGETWKKTKNLRLQDLPVLAYLLRKAEDFLRERDK